MVQFLSEWLKWFQYNLRYFQNPPWETGISPPELLSFLESHPPGHALDLGCGSGTNLVTLARAGWQVTGVDFAIKAVIQARRKLARAHLGGKVFLGDVVDLPDLHPPFDLVLDIGCYHRLAETKKLEYEDNLMRLLKPLGFFLLYGHQVSAGLPGISEAHLQRLAQQFQMVSLQPGTERGRDSLWLLLQKPGLQLY